jgi:hypothetical protein
MKLIYAVLLTITAFLQAPSRPFQPVSAAGVANNLTYREGNYRVDPNTLPAAVPALPASYKLSYRGMTYFVNRTANGEVTIVTQLANTPNVEAKAFPHQALSN